MKTNRVMMILVLTLLVGMLQGCDLNNLPVVDPPAVAPPVVAPVETGSLVIPGTLRGSEEKGFSNADLIRTGDAFIEKVDWACAYLYTPGKSSEKGGGAVAQFGGEVRQGVFLLNSADSGVYIPVGTYELFVDVFFNGNPVFIGKPEGGLITIGSGKNSADVVFDFLDQYWLGVRIASVPVSVGQVSAIKLVSAKYPQSMSASSDADGNVTFSVMGPVQFTGGTVVFLDASGNTILDENDQILACDLQIDMALHYGNTVGVTFVQSLNVASLEISASFAYQTRILVNGEIVDNPWDLPNILFSAGSDIEISVPEGNFDLGKVWLPPTANSITIRGTGVNSRIYGRFEWNRLNCKDLEKGGGGTTMSIDNVMLIDSTPDSMSSENAAIVAWGIDHVLVQNCVIETQSSAVEMTWVAVADISHCSFNAPSQSWNAGIKFFNCGPSPVSLKNCIFSEFSAAVIYDYVGTFYGAWNCLWACGAYTNQGDILPVNSMRADPLWGIDYLLQPGSPCLGRAEDGTNIGFMQADHSTGPRG